MDAQIRRGFSVCVLYQDGVAYCEIARDCAVFATGEAPLFDPDDSPSLAAIEAAARKMEQQKGGEP
jgi:hypothetical protein